MVDKLVKNQVRTGDLCEDKMEVYIQQIALGRKKHNKAIFNKNMYDPINALDLAIGKVNWRGILQF